jgi:TRAP-type C4-dicarboxylate transport system substrate-binding protein
MLKDTGIRLMAYADNGIRHFTNSKKAIKTPDDPKGLKMRVQPSPVFIEMVKALGASPSAIDWAELPAALSQGIVDGQENGVTNILAASLYQSQKHVTLDGHVYSLHAYLMSDAFYQSLSAEQRKIVDEGVEIAKDIHRKLTSMQDMNAGKILSEKGMTVTDLTGDQIDAFRKLAQPAVRAHLEKEAGKELVGKLIGATAAAEKGMWGAGGSSFGRNFFRSTGVHLIENCLTCVW